MRLFEIFDKPYQYTQYAGTSNKLGYAFKSIYIKDGKELYDIIKVEFHRLKNTDAWHLGFHIGGSDQPTANFDSVRIFATIINIIQEFLSNNFTKNLSHLIFSGKVGTGPRAMSRINLYDRLARKIPSLGLEYKQDDLIDGEKRYTFLKR